MRQPQRTRGGRGAVMVKATQQRGDAPLPRAQELLEVVEQGTKCREDAFVIFDFMIEIDASCETLALDEPPARIGTPAEQPIEIGKPRDTETFGEPRARQAQEL